MLKTSALAVALIAFASAAHAQDFGGELFENTYESGSTTIDSTTYAWPLWPDIYAGVNATTVYGNPGIGSDGPTMGTTSDSWSDTSYGAEMVFTW